MPRIKKALTAVALLAVTAASLIGGPATTKASAATCGWAQAAYWDFGSQVINTGGYAITYTASGPAQHRLRATMYWSANCHQAQVRITSSAPSGYLYTFTSVAIASTGSTGTYNYGSVGINPDQTITEPGVHPKTGAGNWVEFQLRSNSDGSANRVRITTGN
jgi:hypothetical protein